VAAPGGVQRGDHADQQCPAGKSKCRPPSGGKTGHRTASHLLVELEPVETISQEGNDIAAMRPRLVPTTPIKAPSR